MKPRSVLYAISMPAITETRTGPYEHWSTYFAWTKRRAMILFNAAPVGSKMEVFKSTRVPVPGRKRQYIFDGWRDTRTYTKMPDGKIRKV